MAEAQTLPVPPAPASSVPASPTAPKDSAPPAASPPPPAPAPAADPAPPVPASSPPPPAPPVPVGPASAPPSPSPLPPAAAPASPLKTTAAPTPAPAPTPASPASSIILLEHVEPVETAPALPPPPPQPLQKPLEEKPVPVEKKPEPPIVVVEKKPEVPVIIVEKKPEIPDVVVVPKASEEKPVKKPDPPVVVVKEEKAVVKREPVVVVKEEKPVVKRQPSVIVVPAKRPDPPIIIVEKQPEKKPTAPTVLPEPVIVAKSSPTPKPPTAKPGPEPVQYQRQPYVRDKSKLSRMQTIESSLYDDPNLGPPVLETRYIQPPIPDMTSVVALHEQSRWSRFTHKICCSNNRGRSTVHVQGRKYHTTQHSAPTSQFARGRDRARYHFLQDGVLHVVVGKRGTAVVRPVLSHAAKRQPHQLSRPAQRQSPTRVRERPVTVESAELATRRFVENLRSSMPHPNPSPHRVHDQHSSHQQSGEERGRSRTARPLRPVQ